ncbi:MAG: CoA pyrophosphatase [Bacteroidota bacterium]
MNSIITNLTERLKHTLPGVKAQLLMGSEIRMKKLKWIAENKKTKNSGVLILLYPHNQSVYSVLIQRPEYKGTHGGQVSLPGGKKEAEDDDIIKTALREAQEEIGVNRNEIRIIGSLSRLYIPPSNFVIYPSVGYISKRPVFIPCAEEVDEIIEYDIMSLLDPEIKKITRIKILKIFSFNAPYFDVHKKIVWGATAMVLSEFREILAEIIKK